MSKDTDVLQSPPSFSETVQNTDAGPAADADDEDLLPPYEIPQYVATTSTSTRLASATAKLPPQMNGYFSSKMMSSLFYFGLASQHPLFAVGLYARRGTAPMVLYDGPSDSDPVLATCRRDKHGLSRALVIEISPTPQNPQGTTVRFETSTRAFTLPDQKASSRSDKPRSDSAQFEWRRSGGAEIKQLAGHSSGWKLVQVSESDSPATTGTGGSRKTRELGYASDGKEVLAVMAYNMSASMTKATKMAFMGRGLMGAFGVEWEVVVALSGLWAWLYDTQIFVV